VRVEIALVRVPIEAEERWVLTTRDVTARHEATGKKHVLEIFVRLGVETRAAAILEPVPQVRGA